MSTSIGAHPDGSRLPEGGETARLTLRGQHGVAADRGRIVREAINVLLADLAEAGEDSVLVRRLKGR